MSAFGSGYNPRVLGLFGGRVPAQRGICFSLSLCPSPLVTISLLSVDKSLFLGKSFGWFFFFFKILSIYLRERERALWVPTCKHEGGAEGEADSPLSKEPDAGLDPRTLGSMT